MSDTQYTKRKPMITDGSDESSFNVKESVFDDLVEEPVEEQAEEKNLANSGSLIEIKQEPLTLSSSKEEIIQRVENTDSIDELKNLSNLFGISLTKKELARASKESDLVDKLVDIAEERINNRGDYLSHDELLDYIKTFQGNVDKSRKTLNDDIDNASTKITHNEVNITVNQSSELQGMSRESREKIMDFLNQVLSDNEVILEEPEEITTVNKENQ